MEETPVVNQRNSNTDNINDNIIKTESTSFANKLKMFNNRSEVKRTNTDLNTKIPNIASSKLIQKNSDVIAMSTISQQPESIQASKTLVVTNEIKKHSDNSVKQGLEIASASQPIPVETTANNFKDSKKIFDKAKGIFEEASCKRRENSVNNTEKAVQSNSIDDKIDEINKKATMNPEGKDAFLTSVEIPEQWNNESFCEGFFISSFPNKDGKVVENSDDYVSTCGHEICSSLPSMQPEIWYRFPPNDTNTLELNNLAASICFPTGIKICYEENAPITTVKNYFSSITNQQGDRYYIMTYHFYYKILNYTFMKDYSMYPIKYQTMRFCDDFYDKIQKDEKLQKRIGEKLQQYSELNFREVVHIPFCLCLISKYPYWNEMEKSLESIKNAISNYSFKSEDITHLVINIIRSIPIPPPYTKLQFALPFYSDFIEISCPLYKDMCFLNTDISCIFNYFSIDNIILIFRLLWFEQKLLFVDSEYDVWSKVTNSFITLIYPFQWIHTYIPIMSEQMLKYLQAFLPFANGIHDSMLPTAKLLLEEAEEGVYWISISKDWIEVNTKKKKYKIKNFINDNLPPWPKQIESKMVTVSKKISKWVKEKTMDKWNIDIMIRNLFTQIFVEMFYDYPNYLTVLDDYPVFNTTSLVESRPKKDEQFFVQFTETQIFQLFIQNAYKAEGQTYFNYWIKEYQMKKQTKGAMPEYIGNFEKCYKEYLELKSSYIIKPYFLKYPTEETSYEEIRKILNEKHPKHPLINENGVWREDKRIVGNMRVIEQNNNPKTYNYYYIPNTKIVTKEEIKPRVNKIMAKVAFLEKKELNNKKINSRRLAWIKGKKTDWDLTENEKDEIKEVIKDTLSRAFKSEELNIPTDMNNILNCLENSFGRSFFIKLIFQTNVQEKIVKPISAECFEWFDQLLFNALLLILKYEESKANWRSAIYLFKSTFLYFKIVKSKNIFLYHHFLKKCKDYKLVTKASFWSEWWELEMEWDEEYKNKKDKAVMDKWVYKYLIEITKMMTSFEIPKEIIFGIVMDQAKFKVENEEEFVKLKETVEKIILSQTY